MSEIANCPHCGGEPSLKYWDYDSDPSIYHCGATLESIVGWNRYAAAMELARVAAYDCTETAKARAMVAYLEAFK